MYALSLFNDELEKEIIVQWIVNEIKKQKQTNLKKMNKKIRINISFFLLLFLSNVQLFYLFYPQALCIAGCS